MAEQLAGTDTAFLALESPELPMHVVGVLLLDPAAGENYSSDRLRQVMADRLHLMAPFRRRLVTVPLSLDRPYWHYEPTVDLDQHVFERTLPAPADLHALGAFVGAVAMELLDRSRPMWEMHIVNGLADGRVAIVAKIHHSSMYGAAGAEFIADLMDFDPAGRTDIAQPEPREEPQEPGLLTLARRTAVSQLKWPLRAGRVATGMARNTLTSAKALRTIVGRHGSAALPFTAPRSAISGTLTDQRTAAFAALPLELTKQTKAAAGVKVNDVVLAVVTMAVRDYLQKRDDVPDRPLVSACPMAAGEGATEGTNVLATMLVPLPLDIDDPAELLRTIHGSTLAAKEFVQDTGPEMVAQLADATPAGVLGLAGWLSRTLPSLPQPPMQSLIISNVMGPPIPLYLAGAQVDAIYPLGPLMPGAGLNITVLSNTDRLDVGVLACPDIVDDVWEIVDAMPAALERLNAAVS